MNQPLLIYNTLSRTKQLFTPVTPGRVGMYVCGPTVYGDAHLGHARPAITFDLLFRYLQHIGYSFESGWSSIHNWESGAPEQIRLYEIMTQTPGIYGGRFSGAGFKGCCMALIDPSYEESITHQVTDQYLASFPSMTGKYQVFICTSANGVKLE